METEILLNNDIKKEKKKISCKKCNQECKNYYQLKKHTKICEKILKEKNTINENKNTIINKNNFMDLKDMNDYHIEEGNKYVYYLKKLKTENLNLGEIILTNEGYIKPDDNCYPKNEGELLIFKLMKNYCDKQNINKSHERIINIVQQNYDKDKVDIQTENKDKLIINVGKFLQGTIYDKAYYEFQSDPFVFATDVYLHDKEFNKEEVNPYIKHLLINILYSKYKDCKEGNYMNYYEFKDIIYILHKMDCIQKIQNKELENLAQLNLSTILFEIRFIDFFFMNFFQYLKKNE